jgi:2-oxoglutarate/2-oxoacid ferredoxin oxidoreductase subunit beta
MSMGQMVEDVERSVKGQRPVQWYGKCGGEVPTPEEIMELVKPRIPAGKTHDKEQKPWPKPFKNPKRLTDLPTHYCPGCTHGVIHRLVAEVIDELGIRAAPWASPRWAAPCWPTTISTCDFQEAAHGRAPAMATGIKRVRPDLMVFTYQGDGDLASIGMGEIIHAANRGEKFTTIFVNNAVYGMTGGQMAPTTMPGQRTTTSPFGPQNRRGRHAHPDGRTALRPADPGLYHPPDGHQAQVHRQGQKGDQKAFTYQIEGRCFSWWRWSAPAPPTGA